MYYRVASLLKARILGGVYVPGELLSTERQIAEEFEVSRITARQALNQLREQGLVTRRRGQGTYVSEALPESARQAPVEFSGFLDDLLTQADHAETRELEWDSTAAAPPDVYQALDLPEGTPILRIDRVRARRGQPYAIVRNWIPPTIADRLDVERLWDTSFLRLLETDIGVRVTESIEDIRASTADEDLAERLGIGIGSPLLAIERVSYAEGGDIVEYVITWYAADRYHFRARLTRV